MSKKKTILGKVLEAILSIFKENWIGFVAKLWKKIPSDLQEKVLIAIKIVDNLKKFVDSEEADRLTAVIPGELDDALKDFLRKILKDYKISEYDLNFASHAHTTATIITQELTGLSFGQSALTTEVAYQAWKKENS
jgi:hypothetical protein